MDQLPYFKKLLLCFVCCCCSTKTSSSSSSLWIKDQNGRCINSKFERQANNNISRSNSSGSSRNSKKKEKEKCTDRAHLFVYFPFGQITTFSSNERKVECITLRCTNINTFVVRICLLSTYPNSHFTIDITPFHFKQITSTEQPNRKNGPNRNFDITQWFQTELN